MAVEFVQKLTTFGAEGTATKIMCRIKELAGFKGCMFVHQKDEIVKNIEKAFNKVILNNYKSYQDLTSQEKDAIKEAIAQKLYQASLKNRTSVLQSKDTYGVTAFSGLIFHRYEGEVVGQVYFPNVFNTVEPNNTWLEDDIRQVIHVEKGNDINDNVVIKCILDNHSNDNDNDNVHYNFV